MKKPKIKYDLQYFKSYDYTKLKNDIRFYAIVILIVFLVICLITGVIKVKFLIGSQESSILFTVLNSLVFGVYFNIVGLRFGITKQNTKLVILVILIIVMLLGFGYFDLQFEFNFFFFAYKIYSTSSYHGIYFFTYNIYIWSSIYFLSFFIESEVEN